MKIGIIADIHCNVAALRWALSDMGSVDEVLFAGDANLQFRFSNEVVEILRQHQAQCVLGNHDGILLSTAGVRVRTNGYIRQENIRLVQSWPSCLQVTLGGKKIYVAHGSPWDNLNEYIMPRSRNTPRLDEVGADIMILGHTHSPMVLRVGRTLAINPGSCGFPRDIKYERQWTYALLDLDTEEVEIRGKLAPGFQGTATIIRHSLR